MTRLEWLVLIFLIVHSVETLFFQYLHFRKNKKQHDEFMEGRKKFDSEYLIVIRAITFLLKKYGKTQEPKDEL